MSSWRSGLERPSSSEWAEYHSKRCELINYLDRSAAKLSYSDAQSVISGGSLTGVDVASEHDATGLAEDIKALHQLAVKLRKRRIDAGTLSLGRLSLRFTLDEHGMPIDCSSEDRYEANRVVEEVCSRITGLSNPLIHELQFMLLTNISVAQQIAFHLPEQALLRRHADPLERRLNGFAERTARTGIKLDVSSAGALQTSLDLIDDEPTQTMFEALLRKTMQTAVYFCSGMLDIAKYSHYALNEPLYTHFTSPIRRYADVLVHRQLESILSNNCELGPLKCILSYSDVIFAANEAKFNMDRDAVAKIAQQCNM